ncbi:MAG: hypothetical protein JO187_10650, partial [Acidobacteria bacterium]|nr:hypothetical protein [Acidobacteriota bacterium]
GFGDPELVHPNLVGSSVTVFDPRTTVAPGSPGGVYFMPSNFSAVSAGYGTLPRNFFRGPGRTNLDLAIAKTTALYGERVNLEFRTEFFNAFNHPEFNNPDTTFGSSTFGQILTTGPISSAGIIETPARVIQFGARVTF